MEWQKLKATAAVTGIAAGAYLLPLLDEPERSRIGDLVTSTGLVAFVVDGSLWTVASTNA